MRLTASTRLVDNLCKPFSDEIIIMKQFGFEGVDYNLNYDLRNMLGDNWQDTIERIAEKAYEIEMPVVQTHLPYSFGRRTSDEVKRIMLEQAITASSILDSKYAVFHAINAPTEEEGLRQTKELFSPIIELADKNGVEMLVEIMPNFCTYPITAEALCECADALGIGICWDFGHPNVNKYHLPNDQTNDLRLVGKRLKALHVNDNAGGRPDEHLPPYMGSVVWDTHIPVLKEIGYDGDFNYEVLVNRVPDYLTPFIADYLITVGRRLMKLCE